MSGSEQSAFPTYKAKIREPHRGVVASKLGWKLEYFSFPQRLGFIVNTLRFKLPGEQYPCDIVMGVPAQYDQVSPTRPYYRSTYALVFPTYGKLSSVKSFGFPSASTKTA
jgi:hypothetical protein